MSQYDNQNCISHLPRIQLKYENNGYSKSMKLIHSILWKFVVLTGIYLFILFPGINANAESTDWTLAVHQHSPSTVLGKLDAAGKEIHTLLKKHGTSNPAGHVLILHGARQNPDWKDVIRPLRLALPDYGWTTLSIEMPAVSTEASDKNYTDLLEQATSSILSAQGNLINAGAKRIIILGYGLGARMAVDWLSKTPQPSVKALVLISMGDGLLNSGIDSNQDLLNIKVPILDIFAEHDSANVLKAAKERYRNRVRLAPYRQLELFATGPFYSQQDEELIKRIRGWLKLTFKNDKNF